MNSITVSIGAVLAILAAYALGSLSFAVLVSRLMGLGDPRGYGSGNPGATNVLRSGNKTAALLTLLFDALKGWLPVALVQQWGGAWGWGAPVVALVGLAAFLGHLYPVFFGFRGGKGVATAAGVLLGFAPLLAVLVVSVWLLAAIIGRYSSLAALLAALGAPLIYGLGARAQWWPQQIALLLAIAGMSAMLIWRHRANIARLINGQETRIGTKKPS